MSAYFLKHHLIFLNLSGCNEKTAQKLTKAQNGHNLGTQKI